MSIVDLARPEVLALRPYVAAPQPADAVRLNANEVPAAASPQAGSLHRYPAARSAPLRERLAALFGVGDDQLLVTRGSSEAIDLLIRAFCRPGRDRVLLMPPTFAMYSQYARIQGAAVDEVALQRDAGFAIDLDAVEAAMTDSTRLVFACSPNNPSGAAIAPADIERLLEICSDRAIVVLDEAYIEFASRPSLASLIKEHENLVVLRTLSKAWGLAGARCGAAIARPAVTELLDRLLPPYAIATPVVERVLVALAPASLAAARAQVAQIISERERLAAALAECAAVEKAWPSDANFLLVRFRNPADSRARLQQNGVLVRDFGDDPQLAGCARITVGTADENTRLLSALRNNGEAAA